MNVKISESIKYIGADTRSLDLFEGQYIIPDGMSYNSYLILDEKTAVIDTVDKIVTEKWLENLKSELNGKAPDYLITEHLEPDHSGSIKTLISLYPEIKLVCTAKAASMLGQFGIDVKNENVIAVKENDELTLGSHTLKFITAPMVHWPEVMVVYEKEEKVLFSADAFGKFGALDCEEDDWACEARRYYFNIVGKYGAPVQTLLKKASALEIKTVCPLHGPVLTDTIPEVLSLYNTWSSYTPETAGVFIAYGSMHGNTKEAALTLQKALEEKGVKTSIADVSRADIAECVEDAFRYSALVCLAPSYDGGVFAPMSDFIHHLKSKAFQNRKVYLCENYSWAASALRTMKSEFEQMKNITVSDNAISIKTTLKPEDEAAIKKLAETIYEETK